MDDGLSVQKPLGCNICNFIFTTIIQEYSSLLGYHSVTSGNKEEPDLPVRSLNLAEICQVN